MKKMILLEMKYRSNGINIQGVFLDQGAQEVLRAQKAKAHKVENILNAILKI